jgi:hypothetical protein
VATETERQRLLRIENVATQGLAAIQIGDLARGIEHFQNAAALAELELTYEEEGPTS